MVNSGILNELGNVAKSNTPHKHLIDKQYTKKAKTEEEKKKRDKESKRKNKRKTEGRAEEKKTKNKRKNKRRKNKQAKEKDKNRQRAGGCGPLRIMTAMMRVEINVRKSNNHYDL